MVEEVVLGSDALSMESVLGSDGCVESGVQGHINPALQFAKRLIQLGVKVTFTTTISAYRKMIKGGQIPESINFEVFSDGFDEGYKPKLDDTTLFLTQLRTRGTQSLKDTILSSAKNGIPVTCLVYTILLPWVSEVANGFSLASTLLWIQPASVLRVYYYYFNGYDKLIGDDCKEPTWSIEIPGLPLLKSRDLPSFCLPSNTYNFALPLFKEQLDMLASEERPTILVNSFDELEEEALKEIDGKLNMVAVGPLIPSAFLDGKDPLDKSFGGDLFETSKEYLQWMNTKPVGVRVTANEDGVVEGEEIRTCIEMVMGGHENGAAMRKNAKKWKGLARDAMKENGSSFMNLKAFVEEVSGSST
ncbi:hypothetical protein Tco_0778676 [Tanacetum coccineum]